ncbi:alpha/beta hydrolase family protein [Dyella japonica]|uniref:Xaa-Pro dipeptidyl-peptidase-like domain-containing protein n=1 Tax=Dyella japonica A8 TaxID=1217721 RepID=A0A075JWZ5_9GAMM|nr:alpha/beta hydrolase [Dyella japonica]AIF46070.1 hypothetical protein HY57_01715 [Dyella japonica A8]
MLATLLAALLAGSAPAADCHIGAYRLSDGSTLDIAPTDTDALRWRHIDGSTGKLTRAANDTWTSTLGWTDRPDGKDVRFVDCAKGKLSFDGKSGQRMPLQVQETSFAGDGGTRLVGRLILPPGQAKVPVVVLVHGAEHDSAMQFDAMQRELPAQGVGAFVYDKRGTGSSAGSYTQDYGVLASDAVAAVAEARRLAGARAGRVGYRGGSQGGWVAPLAATRTKVDFVIVGYGLAVSPLEEDREAVALDLKLKGYDQSVIDKAWELSDAIGLVLSSNLTQGFDQLDAAKAKYGKEPWYKDVRGDFSYMVLPMSDDEIREKGKAFLSWNVPWHYDAMPVLEKLQTPQLWELGEDDIDAPSGETLRRLASLQAKGLPITTALFPHAEHGMTEYEMKGRERVSTRYSAGYMQMTIDYAKGTWHPPYGASKVVMPGNAATP